MIKQITKQTKRVQMVGGDPTTKDPNAKPDKTKEDLLKEAQDIQTNHIMARIEDMISKNVNSEGMFEIKTSSETLYNNGGVQNQ